MFGSFPQHAEQSQVWSNFTSAGNPGFSPSIARIAVNLSLPNEWDSQGEDNVPFLAARNLVAKFVLWWTYMNMGVLLNTLGDLRIRYVPFTSLVCYGLNSPTLVNSAWFWTSQGQWYGELGGTLRGVWRVLCHVCSVFPWEKHRRNMERHAKTWKHNGCI